MTGGIYSKQKCPACGKNLRYNSRAVACPDHPEYQSDKGIYVKFRGITKRFDGDLEGAVRFMTGLRFKTDEKTFDRRDYSTDVPLGFSNLIEKWLEVKRDEVSCYRNLRNYAQVASAFWKNKNIKEIDFGDLEDFVKSLKVSAKTRHNYIFAIHHFFNWCKHRKYIEHLPEFPTVHFKLGYRKVIGKDTQAQILEEIKRTSPFKIYLAIKFLTTYINVRPKEMRGLQEGNIDLENGYLTFVVTKDKPYKVAPLIPEDVKILKQFPTAIDKKMLFFRNEDGTPLYRDALYYAWIRACKNLGIEGVDLYGGTRHSSARALRDHFSPERIKRAVGSATNAAFERYYNIEGEEVRQVFSLTSSEKLVRKPKTLSSDRNVLKP